MATAGELELIGVDLAAGVASLFVVADLSISLEEGPGELLEFEDVSALDFSELPTRVADSGLTGGPGIFALDVECDDSAPLAGLAISVPAAASDVALEGDSPAEALGFAVAGLEAAIVEAGAGAALGGSGTWCSIR